MDVNSVDGGPRKHRDSAASIGEVLTGDKLPRKAASESLRQEKKEYKAAGTRAEQTWDGEWNNAEAERVAGTPAIRHSIVLR